MTFSIPTNITSNTFLTTLFKCLNACNFVRFFVFTTAGEVQSKHKHSAIVGVKQSREYEAHAGRTVHLNVISRSEKNVQTTSSNRLFSNFCSPICLKMSWYCKEMLNMHPESALNRHMSIIQENLSIYMKLTTKAHAKVNVKSFDQYCRLPTFIYHSLN